ncbi:MAG: hypothetical protein ABI585_06455 [Betaproteobacteria bacterium]
MTRSATLTPRAFARAFAWALLALAPAACYYPPYAYTTTVPASFNRSYDAVVGTLADNGMSILMEDRSAGRTVGRRGGIDVTGNVISQADGSVRVEFASSGASAQDPSLIERITRSYNARMGR